MFVDPRRTYLTLDPSPTGMWGNELVRINNKVLPGGVGYYYLTFKGIPVTDKYLRSVGLWPGAVENFHKPIEDFVLGTVYLPEQRIL